MFRKKIISFALTITLLGLSGGLSYLCALENSFSPDVFKHRRDVLLDKLKSGVVILFAAVESRSATKFKQDNDFWYFTGVEEANAVLVMRAAPRKIALFLPRITAREERMSGPNLLADENAAKKHLLDDVQSLDMLIPALSMLSAQAPADVYLRLSPRDTEAVSRTEDIMLYGVEARNIFNDRLSLENMQVTKFMEKYPQHHYLDITPYIDEMRVIKDAAEIRSLRENGKMAAAAHITAIKATRPGIVEFEIEAAALFHIWKNGAQGPAYPPIIASGPNTCILHYNKNNRVAREGELLLMDFGAQKEYLCTDVSRTWPVSGKFSPEQKKVYRTVLEIQKAVIQCLRPGITQTDVARYTEKVLKEKNIDPMGEEGRYHHFIGMCTHDVGPWNAPLREGMVLTVEPGLYFKDKNLGIRIEDTILITKDGSENLSAAVPKEIEEIEALMAK